MIVRTERRADAVALGIADLEPFWPPAAETTHALRPEVWNRSDNVGSDHAMLARATVEARVALEEAVVAAAVAAQRAIDVAQALDDTLAILFAAESELDRTPSPTSDTPRDVDTLSPREREVLALVAEGRSNKAIAETLFVSPNTIKTHVASLLSKLHAESRAQLAAIAARRGLSRRAPGAIGG